MAESFSKWEPLGPIEWPCAGVTVSSAGRDLVLRLEFSSVIGGSARDLLLRFAWGHVVAFASWQESAHPWNNETLIATVPRLGGAWPNYTFPLLEVTQSNLLATLGDAQRASYPTARHFRIVTLDHTVDVVATGDPHGEWSESAVRG